MIKKNPLAPKDLIRLIASDLRISILLPVIIMMPSLLKAQQSQDLETQFIYIKNDMQTAIDSTDKSGLIQAQERMKRFINNENEDIQKLAYYYLAYADSRLYTQFSTDNEKQKDRYLDKAIQYLKNALKIDHSFAEGQALLGLVFGLKVHGIFSGMKYGPKSDDMMEKAIQNSTKNPRPIMLNAISLLNKPAIVGGSTQKAIEGFKKAANLYKSFQPKNKMMPSWGHAEVYAWMGKAYEQNKEYQKAKAAYKQALVINPNYNLVQHKLLPKLAEKMDK